MKSAAVLLLTVSGAFASTGMIPSGGSVINFNRNYSFPPVGLGSAETAQVRGAVFSNATATQVGSTTFTTTANQIFSAQLTFSALASSGVRAEFVA